MDAIDIAMLFVFTMGPVVAIFALANVLFREADEEVRKCDIERCASAKKRVENSTRHSVGELR